MLFHSLNPTSLLFWGFSAPELKCWFVQYIKQPGFLGVLLSFAAFKDFCICYTLQNHWRTIPASPATDHRVRQCCTFPSRLYSVCFCVTEGEVLAPSGSEDLEEELHNMGEARCCLETFSVRTGTTLKQIDLNFFLILCYFSCSIQCTGITSSSVTDSGNS